MLLDEILEGCIAPPIWPPNEAVFVRPESHPLVPPMPSVTTNNPFSMPSASEPFDFLRLLQQTQSATLSSDFTPHAGASTGPPPISWPTPQWADGVWPHSLNAPPDQGLFSHTFESAPLQTESSPSVSPRAQSAIPQSFAPASDDRPRSQSAQTTSTTASKEDSEPGGSGNVAPELVAPPRTMNGRVSHSHRVPRGYIKRPPNGFLRFRSAFIARNAALPKGDPARLEESRVISRAAGIVWRNLGESEREVWKREARKELEEFKERHPDDDLTKRERIRVRRREKQRRAHAAIDDAAADRAAARALSHL